MKLKLLAAFILGCIVSPILIFGFLVVLALNDEATTVFGPAEAEGLNIFVEIPVVVDSEEQFRRLSFSKVIQSDSISLETRDALSQLEELGEIDSVTYTADIDGRSFTYVAREGQSLGPWSFNNFYVSSSDITIIRNEEEATESASGETLNDD